VGENQQGGGVALNSGHPDKLCRYGNYLWEDRFLNITHTKRNN
jgi:hypothetical protein